MWLLPPDYKSAEKLAFKSQRRGMLAHVTVAIKCIFTWLQVLLFTKGSKLWFTSWLPNPSPKDLFYLPKTFIFMPAAVLNTTTTKMCILKKRWLKLDKIWTLFNHIYTLGCKHHNLHRKYIQLDLWQPQNLQRLLICEHLYCIETQWVWANCELQNQWN